MSRVWSLCPYPSGTLAAWTMAVALLLAATTLPALAQVDSTSGSSLTIQVNGTEVARFVPNGISSSGVVQVSGTSLSCAAAIKGALRYSSTSNTLQICVGTTWTSLVSGTAGAGTLTGTAAPPRRLPTGPTPRG